MADRLVAHKQKGKGFERRLVEFADAVRPELTLVDARSVLARNGPESGDVVSGVRRMILSGDMVAVDAYCAHLLAEHDATFSPEMISEQLRHAQSLGLGQPDLSQIQVVEVAT